MITAEANGKTFEFPDGTTTDQMGAAIDEYFSGSVKRKTETENQNEGSMINNLAAVSQPPARTLDDVKRDMASGSSANHSALSKEYAELLKAEKAGSMDKLRAKNPFLADHIESMNGFQKMAVGYVDGLQDITSGLGFEDTRLAADKNSFNELSKQGGAFDAGKFAGQASPFLAPSMLASNIASLPLRTAVMGGIGATEGGAISKGTGGSDSEVVASAGAGLLLGAGSEVLFPVVNSYGRKLVQRLTGSAPATVVTPDGMPTPEFEAALQSQGTTFDDVVSDVAESQGVESTAKMVAETATKGQGTQELIKSFNPSLSRVNAADELGIGAENVPASVLSEEQKINEIGGTLAAIPSSDAAVELQRFTEELGIKADEFLASTDSIAVSQKALDKITKKRDSMYEIESAAYDEVRDLVNRREYVDTSVLVQRISAEADALGGKDKLGAFQKRMLATLSEGPTENQVIRDSSGLGLTPKTKKVKQSNKVTYAKIDAERKRIGAALHKKEGPYADAESAELSSMYSQLSDLQESAARGMGASELWDSAKKKTVARKELEKNSQLLFGKNLDQSLIPKISRALTKIERGDYKDFSALVSAIPKKQRAEVVSTALNGIFTTASGVNKQLTATKYSKWFAGIKRSPTAYKAIKKALPDGGMRRLEALAELSNGLAAVSRNKVKTGIVATALKDFDKSDGFVAKLYNIAESSPVGVSNTMRLSASLAKMSMKEKTPAVDAADRLLRSPSFKKALIDAAKDPKKLNDQVNLKRLEKSDAYKRYMRSMPEPIRSEVASVGFIAWLLGQNPEEE